MLDIKKLEAEAVTEMATEKATAAKSKIKTSLKRIADAKALVRNLENEHSLLLWELGA